MSNPYTGTVASALRKCQLLLQTLDGPEIADNALLQTALQEGALLQLWRGYRAFLGEQAHQLGLGAGAVPESARALQGMVSAGGKFSAEVSELVSLAENPDSWFYSMATAWSGLWRPPVAAAGKMAGVAEKAVGAAGTDKASAAMSGADLAGAGAQSMIPVRQLEASSQVFASVDTDSLKSWQRSLTELIQRQRVQSEEW